MDEDLRYPIGKFEAKIETTPQMRAKFIQTIEELPAKIRAAIKDLNNEQINTPYRAGGWTVNQVVHHVADSHMNCFCRFKFGLTVDAPTIATYDEALWAETAEAKNAPLESSLMIIEGVHARWTQLLKAMSDADFARNIIHPERGKMSLSQMLALYDWHSRHHTAHITNLRKRNGW